MKKRFAVFASGWSEQMLYDYMVGIRDGVKDIDADIYLFLGYQTLGDTKAYQQGELNIYSLPDLNDFDAAFILANGLDFPDLLESLSCRCIEAGIPAVFTGKDDERFYFVGADNYVGARQLCDHLIDVHGAKNIYVVAGSSENEDSNDRLRAISDSMAAHGLTLDVESVMYTDWNPVNAIMMVRKWVESGRALPDAFVCANDKLAMVICAELAKYDIAVPEDVIVTGFDNEFYAQIFSPSISSVDQRFDLIGSKAAELILKVLAGEKCERSIRIPCEFAPSESCGCVNARDFTEIRKQLGKDKFIDSMNESAFYRKLSLMERDIMQSNTYEDIKANLHKAYDIYNYYEGKSVHVLLEPAFKESIFDRGIMLREYGYSDQMDVVLSVDEGEHYYCDDFDVKRIVPHIKDEGKNHFFICLPLQHNGKNLGYLVFADDYDKLKTSQVMQIYIERFENILSRYHSTLSIEVLNRRLVEISETDALTHVKNRTAYNDRELYLDKVLTGSNAAPFSVVLFDINNLKQINDNYGHESGDKYIQNCCNLICTVFKHSAVYRIGGDEFTVILDGDSFTSRRSLLAEFELEMQKRYDSGLPIWERISIAYGLADYIQGQDGCVGDVLQRADSEMYIKKLAMKS